MLVVVCGLGVVVMAVGWLFMSMFNDTGDKVIQHALNNALLWITIVALATWLFVLRSPVFLQKDWIRLVVALVGVATIFIIFYSLFYITLPKIFAENRNEEAKVQAEKKAARDHAVELVRALPEIKVWEKLFSNSDGTNPKTGGQPGFGVGVAYDAYIVSVYEDVYTHTVLFAHYRVDRITGQVTKSRNGF